MTTEPQTSTSAGSIRVIAGHSFEFARHVARGAGGLAWSAYRDGEAEPYRYWQTRTRRELIEEIEQEAREVGVPAHFKRSGR